MDWKNLNGHKPLIVKAARQVGKNESIMHFAKNNFTNIIYLNFALANNIYSFPCFCTFLILDYLKQLD